MRIKKMNNFRYKYNDEELKELLSTITIVIDTREKKNENITSYFDKKKIKYIEKALTHADYTFYIPKNEKFGINRDVWFDKDIVIEKKSSLEELSGNLTVNRTRFEEELGTSKALYKYLLIENARYEDVVDGKYNTDYNAKSYLGTLHSFNHKYNLQIVFIQNPKYTPIFILGTFQYYLRNLIK